MSVKTNDSESNIFYQTIFNSKGEKIDIPIEKIDSNALLYRCDGMRHLFESIRDNYISVDMLYDSDLLFIRDSVSACIDILESKFLNVFDSLQF